ITWRKNSFQAPPRLPILLPFRESPDEIATRWRDRNPPGRGKYFLGTVERRGIARRRNSLYPNCSKSCGKWTNRTQSFFRFLRFGVSLPHEGCHYRASARPVFQYPFLKPRPVLSPSRIHSMDRRTRVALCHPDMDRLVSVLALHANGKHQSLRRV